MVTLAAWQGYWFGFVLWPHFGMRFHFVGTLEAFMDTKYLLVLNSPGSSVQHEIPLPASLLWLY